MADIVDVISADHRRLQRLEAALRDAERSGAGGGSRPAAASVWDRLAVLLEAHADAEEEICHLPLSAFCPGADDQVQELAADLDDIREAVAEARLQPPGSPLWWRTVNAALAAYRQHHDRRMRLVASGFLRAARPGLPQALARQWLGFTAARALPGP